MADYIEIEVDSVSLAKTIAALKKISKRRSKRLIGAHLKSRSMQRNAISLLVLDATQRRKQKTVN